MEQKEKCLDMLKKLPPETEEDVATIERFDKLEEVIAQVRAQLALRRLR